MPAKTPTPKRSPVWRKALTKAGEALDLGGKGLLGVGFAAMFLKGQAIGSPGPGAMALFGFTMLLAGIYLQAEAER